MEGFVAHKLNEYATGKLSRRALIETLTLAATTAYAGGAGAAEQSGIKLALVNHISYNCPNFRQAADWISSPRKADQTSVSPKLIGGSEITVDAWITRYPEPGRRRSRTGLAFGASRRM